MNTKTVLGYDLEKLCPRPLPEAAQTAHKAAADGIVLLKNEGVLPFKAGECISVFGRSAFDYNKSGTGSGGLVNTIYTINIIEGLKEKEEEGKIRLNQELEQIYRSWLSENPFDEGEGWASEPWFQKEMPVDEALCRKAASASDAALVVIGRTCGEDRDNHAGAGSYLLTEDEENLLCCVSKHFSRVAVALNVGNLIDHGFLDRYPIGALLYLWQGGQEGGRGAADVLLGDVNPAGHLAATAAFALSDYPSDKNFGHEDMAIYQEDIYVGYRYFSTFAPEKMRFPFGFGLSYTTFDISVTNAAFDGADAVLHVRVTNTGAVSGREVVQVYYKAPQGKLGKPLRVLGTFQKTDLIQPGAAADYVLTLPLAQMASFDDSGVTGHPACMVLEAGIYQIYCGSNVRDAECVLKVPLDQTVVTEYLTPAAAPTHPFQRLMPVPGQTEDDICSPSDQDTPVAPDTTRTGDRIVARRPAGGEYSGDRGIRLSDVADGKATMEAFLAQLTDEDLCCMARGEGMNSPKVTAGTGAAFGGVTDRLLAFGIPVMCCTDGPSGIRMDSGAHATSLPIGTMLACTWDPALVELLYTYVGLELRGYHVDFLLGPGVNIQRHVLNGRNFEYFSEDPILTGKMASAITRGLKHGGACGTVKHLCANNQECARHSCDSVISQRALREIYLKPFEMAVKEGEAGAVMTAYNRINGVYATIDYDLCTTILRDDWGYQGIVMSDWWASNVEDIVTQEPKNNLAGSIRAQNDVYMVLPKAQGHEDNTASSLAAGTLTRGELLRGAANLCRAAFGTAALERLDARFARNAAANANGNDDQIVELSDSAIKGVTLADCSYPMCGGAKGFGLFEDAVVRVTVTISFHEDYNPLSQGIIHLRIWDNHHRFTVGGGQTEYTVLMSLKGGKQRLVLESVPPAITVESIKVEV